MTDDPLAGPGHKLPRLLQDFFSWLARLFSKKARRLDPEERIDLPTSVIYGEKTIPSRTPSWMTEPPKSRKDTDDSQPRSHSEEWAQQKARFMRSPILKRKEAPDSDGAPRKRPPSNRYRVRFAPTPEYLESPTKTRSQDPGFPPGICIEDWSSPRSPRGSRIKTHSPLGTEPVITASMLRSNPASSSWLPLIVPLASSLCPGVEQSRLQSSQRGNIGVIGDVRHLCSSLDALAHQNARERGRNHGQIQSPSSYQPHLPVQDFKKLGALTREGSSLARNRRLRPLSDLQLSGITSYWDSDTDDEEKRGKINNFNKPARRHSTGDTDTRRSRKRQRIPARPNFEPRMYTSHPLSAKTTPLWDDVGLAQRHTREGKEDMQGGDLIREGGSHGEKIATFGMPVPPGVTFQPGLQRTVVTRFYERQGLAQTPDRNSLSSKRPSSTSWTINQFSVPFDSGSDEVPYPDVFDLDLYFQDSLPTATTSPAATVVLSSPTFTLDSLVSNSESRDSIITPTPAPRRRFSAAPIMTPIRSPGSAHVTQSTHCLTFNNVSGSDLQETALTACDHPSPPFNFEEERSNRRSEDSDAPSSPVRNSGSPSISPGSEWHTDSSGADDSVSGGGDTMIGIMGTNAPPSSASSGLPSTPVAGGGDLNVSLPDGMSDTNSTPRTQNHDHFEMNQIRATLRNTYDPTNRHYDNSNDNSIQDEHNESQVSFVESYSSGSTLSHRHYHHYWRIRHASQLEAEDQRLSPVLEYPNGTTPEGGFVVSEAKSRGSTDSSHVTQTPAPVAQSRRSADVGVGFGVGLQFTFGVRNQPEPVQDRDRYRGSAFTRASGVFVFSPILGGSVDEGIQETTRDVCAINRRPRGGGAGFPYAARPIGGRVMPQKF